MYIRDFPFHSSLPTSRSRDHCDLISHVLVELAKENHVAPRGHAIENRVQLRSRRLYRTKKKETCAVQMFGFH